MPKTLFHAQRPFPPAPWETGEPVIVSLNRIADYLAHHNARVVDVRRPRYGQPRFVVVAMPQQGKGQKASD